MRDDAIIIDWRNVNDESGQWAGRWNCRLALYGILHPNDDEILYLGKADGCTVRSRWNASDKHHRVWRALEKQRGLFEHVFIVGEFHIPVTLRLTRKLVSDIESLLIHQLQPWANQQNTKSRAYTRPGMVVVCRGEWPFKRKTYRDE